MAESFDAETRDALALTIALTIAQALEQEVSLRELSEFLIRREVDEGRDPEALNDDLGDWLHTRKIEQILDSNDPTEFAD